MSLEFLSLETIQQLAQDYGYWTIFIGIMLENAGIPIPGETITLAGGFLAGSDELNYWYVLGCAIAGAVLGDNFGYWLGAWGGWPLLKRLGTLFRIQEAQLLQVKESFGKNAARAVLLGRFVALLRIFAGPLAGIAQMSYPYFLLCNLIGAATWASIMVSLAYFVGRLIPLATLVGWVAQLTVLALLIVVGWLGITWWLEFRPKASPPLESQE